MPDWKAEIRGRVEPLRLPPARERSIIEELSQHLDDHYRELRDAGVSNPEARRTVLAGLETHELLRVIPVRDSAPAAIDDTGSGGTHVAAHLFQDLR